MDNYIKKLKNKLHNLELQYEEAKAKYEKSKSQGDFAMGIYLSGRMHELRVIINELKEIK